MNGSFQGDIGLNIKEDKMSFENIIFGLITNSGEARSYAMEALKEAREGSFDRAKELIELSEEKLLVAHKSQTELIQLEASGEKIEVNILLIHAQDHLMNAITIKDLAIEIVELHKKIER